MSVERKEMLFIGGPLDGKREIVDVMPRFRVIAQIPPGTETGPMEFPLKEEVYRLMKFSDGITMMIYEVYVHQSVDLPVKKLLQGYNP